MLLLYLHTNIFVYEMVQSERSDDMFRDDIFGESPAGVRKTVSPTFHAHRQCITSLTSDIVSKVSGSS